MPYNLRLLIAESETSGACGRRRQSVGRSSGETYADTLRGLHKGVATELARPVENGAMLLATNPATSVQAAEIKCGPVVFWGVKYHPELPLGEIAAALRRQGGGLMEQGLALGPDDVEEVAGLIEQLGQDPTRQDLARCLGVKAQVADPVLRKLELHNFIRHLVLPMQAVRGRG